jgi:hypothetical protein
VHEHGTYWPAYCPLAKFKLAHEVDNTHTFARQPELLALHLLEDLEELLEEADELRRKPVLVRDVRRALRVADADRLFNVQHRGDVRPAVLVHGRLRLTIRP